jgi:hypothetical protein
MRRIKITEEELSNMIKKQKSGQLMTERENYVMYHSKGIHFPFYYEGEKISQEQLEK